MASELSRRRVVIHGDVQGVWFRDSTREKAHSLGLSGWVCNRPDGAVEAVFEGPGETVEELVRFCESGPPRAEVERVEVSEEPADGLRGFEVR